MVAVRGLCFSHRRFLFLPFAWFLSWVSVGLGCASGWRFRLRGCWCAWRARGQYW